MVRRDRARPAARSAFADAAASVDHGAAAKEAAAAKGRPAVKPSSAAAACTVLQRELVGLAWPANVRLLRVGLPRRFYCADQGGGDPMDRKTVAEPPALTIDPAAEFAALHLISVMAWPRNPEKRNALLAGISAEGAELCQDVLDAVAAGVDLPKGATTIAGSTKLAFEERLFEPAGGRRMLVRSLPLADLLIEAHEGILLRGQVIGAVLCFAAQLGLHHADIASLNRAWAIFERDPSIQLLGAPVTEAQFKEKWWLPERAIAPLHAAFHLLRAVQAPNRLRLDQEELCATLGWAKWFRQWATTFRAKRAGAGTVLIPETEAWMFDADVPEIKPPLAPLNEARLQIARSYWYADAKPAKRKRGD